jgi:hypothetical protein
MNISNKQRILDSYLLEKFRASCAHPGKLSVGVEHEFFVVNLNGTPANLDLTQNFLRRLSEIEGWRIFKSEYNHELRHDVILRVSKDGDKKGFTAVKYEYPPSLLEIASNYYFNVDDLKRDLYETWDAIHSAAEKSGCRILSVPFLRDAKKNKDVALLIDPKFKDLSESRRACFLQRNEVVDEEIVDFTCYSASTQVHIGGIEWWKTSDFFDSLYRAEEKLAHCPYRIAGWSALESQLHSRTRWDQYRRVFKGFSLLGFPDLKTWTFSEWREAIMRAPLVINPNGKSPVCLEDLEWDKDTIDVYISKIRDLQIIKPKLIGTIEFRADPAMPGIDEIYNLSLLRLLICQTILSLPPAKNIETFSEARDFWWNKMLAEQTPNSSSDQILDAVTALSSEHRYVDFRELIKRIA